MASCVVQQCEALIFSQNNYQTLCNPPCHQETCCLKALSFQALISLPPSAGNKNVKNWKNWSKAIFHLSEETDYFGSAVASSVSFAATLIPRMWGIQAAQGLLSLHPWVFPTTTPSLLILCNQPVYKQLIAALIAFLIPCCPAGTGIHTGLPWALQGMCILSPCCQVESSTSMSLRDVGWLSSTDLLHLSAEQVDFDYSWTQF